MDNKCFFLVSRLLASVCSLSEMVDSQQIPTGSSVRTLSIPLTVMRHGADFVTGLDASAFSLFEGGRSRPLISVTEVPPLLVGTNRATVAFVVFDALSTPRSEVINECLDALAESVLNQAPMSLSEIDREGLKIVHEISTPNSVLVAALLLLEREKPFLTHRDQLAAMQWHAPDQASVEAETDRLKKFRQGSVQLSNMMGRFLAQLKAFQEIATALQHANGHKTVLWATSYFPVDVSEVQDSINIESFGITSGFPVKSASIDYQRTIDMLNSAQISVFPTQLPLSQSNTSAVAPLSERKTATGLRQFAGSTGGEVLSSSETITNMIKRAEDLTTSYYLVRFQPEAVKADIKWRTLKVQVRAEDVRVSSPNGLFVFQNPK